MKGREERKRKEKKRKGQMGWDEHGNGNGNGGCPGFPLFQRNLCARRIGEEHSTYIRSTVAVYGKRIEGGAPSRMIHPETGDTHDLGQLGFFNGGGEEDPHDMHASRLDGLDEKEGRKEGRKKERKEHSSYGVGIDV